jgi:hypothetical protein
MYADNVRAKRLDRSPDLLLPKRRPGVVYGSGAYRCPGAGVFGTKPSLSAVQRPGPSQGPVKERCTQKEEDSSPLQPWGLHLRGFRQGGP